MHSLISIFHQNIHPKTKNQVSPDPNRNKTRWNSTIDIHLLLESKFITRWMWNNANQSGNLKLFPSASRWVLILNENFMMKTSEKPFWWHAISSQIGMNLSKCQNVSSWYRLIKRTPLIGIKGDFSLRYRDEQNPADRLIEKGTQTQILWLNAFVGLIERHFSVDVWWIRLINLPLFEFYLAMTQIWKRFFELFSFFRSFFPDIFSHWISI